MLHTKHFIKSQIFRVSYQDSILVSFLLTINNFIINSLKNSKLIFSDILKPYIAKCQNSRSQILWAI